MHKKPETKYKQRNKTESGKLTVAKTNDGNALHSNLVIYPSKVNDLIIIPVRINQQYLNALIDTGSTASYIEDKKVNEMNLDRKALSSPKFARLLEGQTIPIYDYVEITL